MSIEEDIIREQINAGILSGINSFAILYDKLYKKQLPDENIEDLLNIVISLKGLLVALIDIDYNGNVQNYVDAIQEIAKMNNPEE